MGLIKGPERLIEDIEITRGKLLALGAYYGINDPIVLNASRELDKLILSYYKKTMEKST